MSNPIRSILSWLGVAVVALVWAAMGQGWWVQASTDGVSDAEWSALLSGAAWSLGLGLVVMAGWALFLGTRSAPAKTSRSVSGPGLAAFGIVGLVVVVVGAAAISNPLTVDAPEVAAAEPVTVPSAPITRASFASPKALPRVVPATTSPRTLETDTAPRSQALASTPVAATVGGGPALWRLGFVALSTFGVSVIAVGRAGLLSLRPAALVRWATSGRG